MEFNEYYQKKTYITQLSYALSIDTNSMVDFIIYTYDDDAADEVITIAFKDGSTKKILATGNSNGQNAKEVVRAVYG